MTLLRLAGCLLIGSACAIWSADRRHRLRDHLDALDSACRFIAHTRREIEYFATPFPEIVRTFGDPRFSNYAKAENITAIAEDFPLAPDERAELAKFLASVGRGNTDAELRLCSASLEIMTSFLDRAREDYPRRAKTFTALALLVGASAAILII